jgi:hypothetical protein
LSRGWTPVEVERVVSKDGNISLAANVVLAAEILGGQRVGIRIEPEESGCLCKRFVGSEAQDGQYGEGGRPEAAGPGGGGSAGQPGFLDELMDQVDEGGVQLTGEGGFLPELVNGCWRPACRPS